METSWESLTLAAVRELHEETGLLAEPASLVGPVLRADQPFTWAGRDYVNGAIDAMREQP